MELTHFTQLSCFKTFTKILGKSDCEGLEQGLSILGTLLSALLINNALADIPLRLNHRKVNGGIGLVASGVENRGNLLVKTFGHDCRFSTVYQFAHHCRPTFLLWNASLSHLV